MIKRIALVLTVIIMLAMMYPAKTSVREQWVMQSCFDLDSVTRLLNSLPPEKALSAKVVAINSQRSFMGALSDPYKVWYIK